MPPKSDSGPFSPVLQAHPANLWVSPYTSPRSFIAGENTVKNGPDHSGAEEWDPPPQLM